MKLANLLALTAAPFALFAANPALADNHAEPAAAPSAKGPALWKVADEDTTVYLFGTVHMLPSTVDWNSGVVNTALATSQTLVTEIDLTPETEASIVTAFQTKGTLPEGQTLRGLMTEAQRTAYEGGLGKLQIPPGAFDQMEPWLASIVLLQIVTQASGFTPDMGVETVLEKTMAPGTARVALETVDDQIKVFDEMAIDQQLTYLLEFAADPIEGIKSLNALVDDWSKGNADGVGAMMNEALQAHPALAERLLYSRNATWAEWIDARLDQPGTVFIAVGAGHLAGEKSVQEYLAAKGIAAARVN